MRFRSRVVKWTMHSRSRSCWIPNATAIAPIRTRAIAESLMLTRSTPASWSSRAASIVRSIRIERGGSISTEMTNRPAASVSASGVGGGARGRRPLAPRRSPRDQGRHGAVSDGGRVERRSGARPTAAIASSAARIAAMCSGVVPQQPPMMRGARREEPRHGPAEVVGLAGVDELALDPLRQAGVRAGSSGRSSGSPSAGHPLESLEAGERPDAAVHADRVDARRRQGRRGGLGRRAVGRCELLAERHLGDDRQVRRRRAPRRSRAAGARRSKNVSKMSRSAPPSSSPSICSRNAARTAASGRWHELAVGRAERPDRARHPRFAAGHVARLAGQLGPAAVERAALVGQPVARRAGSGWRRTSPSRSASAPASRYSRWIAPIRSGRRRDQLVEACPLRDAARVQERAHRPVREERSPAAQRC